jgi:hypothetical protein
MGQPLCRCTIRRRLESGPVWFQRLSSADIIVTGRHHGVYLAVVAGLPFVALGSNTFKIEGLLKDLDMQLAFAHDIAGIERARSWALERRDHFVGLLDRLTSGLTLTTFAALGRGGPDREIEEVNRLRTDLAAA